MNKEALIEKGKSYWPFLALVILALVTFRAGDNTYGPIIYWVLGFFVVLVFVLFGKGIFNKNEISANLVYFIPLLVVLFFGSFNQFLINGNMANIMVCLLLFLGLCSFFIVGLFLRRTEVVKPKHVYFTVLGALGLLVFINFIANCASYPFMYRLLYSDYTYFYEGIPHIIGNESQFLSNFSLVAVKPDFAMGPAVILAASAGTLFFVRWNKDSLVYIAFQIILALVGWLFILGCWDRGALIIAGVCVAVAGIYRLIKPKKEIAKPVALTWIILVSIAGVALIALVLNAIFQFDFIANNSLLNYIFNNGRSQAIGMSFVAVFNGGVLSGGPFDALLSVLFGVPQSGQIEYAGEYISITSIGNSSFEFEFLLEGGLICFLALLVFILAAIPVVRRYFIEDEIKPEKVGLSLLVLAIFFFYSFGYVTTPTIVANHLGGYYAPVTYGSYMMLLALFLLGYTYNGKNPEEEVVPQGEETKEVEA